MITNNGLEAISKIRDNYSHKNQDIYGKYEVWMTREEIKQVQRDIKKNKIKLTLIPFDKHAMKIRSKYVRKLVNEDAKIEDDGISSDFDQNLIEKYLEQVINVEFPQYLFETFKNEYILDDAFAKRIFVEYAKFLVMLKLDNCDISPGFWVDMLWHTHMQHTKLYRDFCYSFFGRMIGHHPNNDSRYNKNEYEDFHKNTLQVYAKMFGPSVNYQIWCDPTYKNSESCLVNVNLLAMIESYVEYKVRRNPKNFPYSIDKSHKPKARHF